MSRSRSGIRVLAIGVDGEERGALGRALDGVRTWEIDCEVATDFQDGLKRLNTQSFDLLFLDISTEVRSIASTDHATAGSERCQGGLLRDPLSELLTAADDSARGDSNPICGALSSLRELGHDLATILLTGATAGEFRLDAMPPGATDYLVVSKLDEEPVERVMTHALEKHALLRQDAARRRELIDTNQDLTRRNREIMNFYLTLSHELKTPLTAAREFISIVLDGLGGPVSADQTNFLGIARSSLDQLKVYVEDLIDVARLETGKLRISRGAGDLTALLVRLVQCAKLEADRRGVTVVSEFDESLPSVFIDESRIAQVVNNLLGNALKFTPSGGQIRVGLVRCSEQPGSVLMVVEDSGTGIDAEHVEKVFDRLYQVDRDEGPEHEGLGLGLNICREIVGLHEGDIWAESIKGEGATFYVRLPIAPAPAREQKTVLQRASGNAVDSVQPVAAEKVR